MWYHSAVITIVSILFLITVLYDTVIYVAEHIFQLISQNMIRLTTKILYLFAVATSKTTQWIICQTKIPNDDKPRANSTIT